MRDQDYLVKAMGDNLYNVYRLFGENGEVGLIVFTGTLSDCAIWVRLKKDGYLNSRIFDPSSKG